MRNSAFHKNIPAKWTHLSILGVCSKQDKSTYDTLLVLTRLSRSHKTSISYEIILQCNHDNLFYLSSEVETISHTYTDNISKVIECCCCLGMIAGTVDSIDPC